VAHDFNNLLFVINTYSEGFLYNLSTQDPLFHDFQEIHKAAKRATTLTQQLLAFSRKQIASPSIIDPNEAIKQLQRMLERLIGEHISINVVPGINVGNIRIDSGQLDQVMMNLAVNARDAMPGGGTITVEINQVRLGRADLKGRNSVCPGIYVLIRFTDNGVGMDEHTKSKMFDPFFSTKGPGKGTGLGLSTIYGIVKQNGGFIEVDSSLGVGTTFTVYFPQYEPDNISNMLLNQNNGELEGSETILLVEDEQQVRKLAAKLLRHLGYNVIEARGASEAATIFHECHQEIDLLFTDIVMPGMNGKQLSRLLGVTKPHLKVLFMSGYNDEISDNMGQLDPKTAFIAKPFSSSDLSMKLREVLDAKL
jgi:two-component system, cell cycle sensor histidine kinase and response regulator CckA